MEKFYEAQIPYFGIIPILLRRGPLRSVELSQSQIETLVANGVPVVNADDGKPFVFITEDGPRCFETKAEAAAAIVRTPNDPNKIIRTTETEPGHYIAKVDDDESKIDMTVHISEPETPIVDDDESDGEPESEEKVESTDGGNQAGKYFKLEDYADLGSDKWSRNFRKKVRNTFIEALGNVPEGAVCSNEDYKAAVEVAREFIINRQSDK